MRQSPEEFGRRLRGLREDRGISVRGLAKQLGVSSVTVWKWEKGDASPRPRSLAALAAALGTTSARLGSLPIVDAARVSPAVQPTGGIKEGGEPALPSSSPSLPLRHSAELSGAIARAKQMIADAAGTSAQSVKIRIEY